ncbi:MAG TPA: cation diffusion facilitator family transporter [Caulobacteraceae bacterium]|jgi:cation diffusion facilitator family transporter
MTAAGHGRLSLQESAALTRGATLLSVLTATVLIAVKAAAWATSGSVAMLASLADSALDLTASAATFAAVRYAARAPDSEHRFGHGKAEAFASLLQAGLVLASAGLIGREAIGRLLAPEPVRSSGLAIGVMAVSILLTGLLVLAQTRVLRRTASVAVEGDRLHYVSDLFSNAVVLLGLAAAAWLDAPWIDGAAALLVAVWFVWSAIQVFRGAADQLMDRELPDDARAGIVTLMRKDPRVLGVHQLKTRASGPTAHIQMHVDLNPHLSLIEAHDVIVAAEERLARAYPAAEVLLHPDPAGHAEPHGTFGEESPPPAPR